MYHELVLKVSVISNNRYVPLLYPVQKTNEKALHPLEQWLKAHRMAGIWYILLWRA
jgi:hypothetical protein